MVFQGFFCNLARRSSSLTRLRFLFFFTLLLFYFFFFLVVKLVELEQWFLFKFARLSPFTFGSFVIFNLFGQLLLLHYHLILVGFEENVKIALHIDAPFLGHGVNFWKSARIDVLKNVFVVG